MPAEYSQNEVETSGGKRLIKLVASDIIKQYLPIYQYIQLFIYPQCPSECRIHP